MIEVLSGDAPPFHQEWQAFLNNTSVYKACSRIPLPARVKAFIRKRTDDIVCYTSEVLIVLILLGALFSGYDGAGVRSNSIKADFWKIVTHPDFPEAAESICPRFYSWYAFFVPIQQRASLEARRVAYEVKNTKKNFSTLFTRTPAEAVNMYRAGQLRAGGRLPKIPSGCVRLHFYTTLEKGKCKDRWDFPDATLDLPIKKQGIDLSTARKTWGIESIAIVTNAESFKSVFYPANEDWLSPLAAYDLSLQFTQPIRIFEPRVHKFTNAERKIRGHFYNITFFLFSFTKLLLGFPERDIQYLSVLYGSRYSSFYQRVAKFTPPIKDWFVTGGLLFLQLAIIICALPFAIAYNACLIAAKGVYWALTIIYRASIAAAQTIFCSMAATASLVYNILINAAIFTSSLQWRDWCIVLTTAWWALAEYHDVSS